MEGEAEFTASIKGSGKKTAKGKKGKPTKDTEAVIKLNETTSKLEADCDGKSALADDTEAQPIGGKKRSRGKKGKSKQVESSNLEAGTQTVADKVQTGTEESEKTVIEPALPLVNLEAPVSDPVDESPSGINEATNAEPPLPPASDEVKVEITVTPRIANMLAEVQKTEFISGDRSEETSKEESGEDSCKPQLA